MSGNKASKGNLILVLHAHLPYVRNPEKCIEERWLFESITESYIPLLSMLDRLKEEKIQGSITFSISPTLIAMLDDSLLRDRYEAFLDEVIGLARREVERTKESTVFNPIAKQYLNRYVETKKNYRKKYNRDIIGRLIEHHKSGLVELITTAATNSILPLLREKITARAQVEVAIDVFTRRVGEPPKGFWLPEWGFNEQVAEVLEEKNLWYTFVSEGGFLSASSAPVNKIYSPLVSEKGLAFFASHSEAIDEVCSASGGFPGDPLYREFYHDVGFDLKLDYLRPYSHPDRPLNSSGFKYYQTTGTGTYRLPYDHKTAAKKAREHAGEFVKNRLRTLTEAGQSMDRLPLLVCPYEAEVFGFWWHEGFHFLEEVIRISAADSELSLTTPSKVLLDNPVNQCSLPSLSSLGEHGFFSVWLDECNAWFCRYLHFAEIRMKELMHNFNTAKGLTKRAVDQALREVMLSQASDWLFIMRSGISVEFAIMEARLRLRNFHQLYEQIVTKSVDEHFLSECERVTPIFPNINFCSFSA